VLFTGAAAHDMRSRGAWLSNGMTVSEAKDRLLDGLDRGHFSKGDYEDAMLLTERTAGAITQLILSLDISPP